MNDTVRLISTIQREAPDTVLLLRTLDGASLNGLVEDFIPGDGMIVLKGTNQAGELDKNKDGLELRHYVSTSSISSISAYIPDGKSGDKNG